MKFVCVAFLLVVASVQAITDEQKEMAQGFAKACVEETGISMDVVNKLKARDFTVDDPKIPAFTVCVMKKAGFMDSEGNFHKEVMISMASTDEEKAMISDILDKCLAKVGTVTEANAHEMCHCVHSMLPEDIGI